LNLRDLLDEDYDPAVECQQQAITGRRLHRAHQEQYGSHAVMDDILAHAEDPEASAAAFNPTFSASRYERVWILDYLGLFYEKQLISDVLRKVKGGKEATVYCCAGGSAVEMDLVAAKVYRPRQFRNLRNDALYREGREILGLRGQPVRDRRALLAVRKGTRKGQEMEHTSWLAHEYVALQELHAAGVRVPRPLAFANNTILMEYVGDLKTPAPVLHSVRLAVSAAWALFEALVRDVELMLAYGHIHADLSAFNVLYLDGDYRIIDFPQAVDPAAHSSAYPLLLRDLTRLCQYFARYGITADPAALTADMWARVGPAACG